MARSNSFEGGSNGVTLTSGSGGNTGGASGDFLNTVSVGVGATVAFSTAQSAHGSVSMTTSTTGSSSLAYAGYTMASVSSDFSRAYCRFGSLPSAATQPILRYLSSGTQAYRVNVKTAGAIEIRDSANSVVGTTTSTISAGSWFRIELSTTFSATVGAVTLRLYLSPDSTTISDSLTLTGLTLTAVGTDLRIGVGSAMANAVQVWTDDVAIEGATWHGPALRSITVTGIAVPADIGSPTADSGAPTSVAPSGIAVVAELGSPTIAQAFTAAPSGIAVPVALGSPTIAQTLTVVPGGLALPLALGPTAVAQNLSVTPSGITAAVTPGDPAASQLLAVAPGGVAVPVALGTPDTSAQTQAVAPDGIAVPVTLGSAAVPVSSIVLRPDTGTTSRPTLGTALRPTSGTTTRPTTGTVTRPFTGTVERP